MSDLFGKPLSPREREALVYLVSGASNKRIAARLKISEHTAKYHVNSILEKLGACSRVEAIVIALRTGLATLPIDGARPQGRMLTITISPEADAVAITRSINMIRGVLRVAAVAG